MQLCRGRAIVECSEHDTHILPVSSSAIFPCRPLLVNHRPIFAGRRVRGTLFGPRRGLVWGGGGGLTGPNGVLRSPADTTVADFGR